MVPRRITLSRGNKEKVIMSANSKVNRPSRQTADQKLIDGVNKHESTLPALLIGGASITPTDIRTTLQARIATANTAVSTRATWQAAVKADIDERAKTQTFVSGLRQALKVAFADSIEALADFGLTPRKVPAARTPEEKAQATAKAKATRTARHTMGTKQKAQVKGTLTPSQPLGDETKVPAAAPAATSVKS
jgi:hypothetical protein